MTPVMGREVKVTNYRLAQEENKEVRLERKRYMNLKNNKHTQGDETVT